MAESQPGTGSGEALSRDRPAVEGEQVWCPSQGRFRDHRERLEEVDSSNSPPRATRTHMLFPKQTYLLSALSTYLALCW